ncbi:TRAP transporter substrate-binding protein [Xanthobacteraceae bacterium A53D]
MTFQTPITRRSLLGGAVLGTAVLAAPGLVRAQAPITMKIGTATLNDAQHEWMKMFARLLDVQAKGRIKVEIYPSSQLGSIPRMVEGTQFGSIQAVVAPPEFLSGVDTRFEVVGAPGVFRDVAQATATLQDPTFSKAFLAVGGNKGLKGIGVFVNAPAIFNTRTKIEHLKDFSGQKIRVFASPIQTEQIKKIGATAVPMSLGEVLPALQQGTIDGLMSVLPVLTAMRFYDAAKYIVETDQAMVTVVSAVSKIWFDKLPADLQTAVVEAGAAASAEVAPWAVDFTAKQRAAWTAAGGELTKLPAAEEAEFMTMLKPIGAEVSARNPQTKALFELLIKTAASKA